MAAKDKKTKEQVDSGFDYAKTVAGVEEILAKVENPETGVEEAEKLIEKARGDIEHCRAWLRAERDKIS